MSEELFDSFAGEDAEGMTGEDISSIVWDISADEQAGHLIDAERLRELIRLQVRRNRAT